MRLVRLAVAVLTAGCCAVIGAGSATAATSVSRTATLPGAHRMTCSAPGGMTCAPGRGNRVVGSVTWYRMFPRVTDVCATLRFTGDLVDPGEGVNIAFTTLSDGYSGFVNTGTTSISSRTLCWNSSDHPEVTNAFLDGTQNFRLFMDTQGSAKVASVEFTLTY